MSGVEIIRRTYKPEVVKVLYIGESVPAGRTFFYNSDSILFDAIHKAYKEVLPACGNGRTFLRFFQFKGCYLVDLCDIPVNKLPYPQRQVEREKGIIPLSEKIKKFQPQAIVILMSGIEKEVHLAISRSGIKTIYINTTPFPFGKKNTENCIEQNISILEDLIKLNIIH